MIKHSSREIVSCTHSSFESQLGLPCWALRDVTIDLDHDVVMCNHNGLKISPNRTMNKSCENEHRVVLKCGLLDRTLVSPWTSHITTAPSSQGQTECGVSIFILTALKIAQRLECGIWDRQRDQQAKVIGN